jgi:hypothetical protein
MTQTTFSQNLFNIAFEAYNQFDSEKISSEINNFKEFIQNINAQENLENIYNWLKNSGKQYFH